MEWKFYLTHIQSALELGEHRSNLLAWQQFKRFDPIILNVMKCQKRSDLMNEVVVVGICIRIYETISGGIFVGRLTKVLPTCVMTWPCGHIQVVS